MLSSKSRQNRLRLLLKSKKVRVIIILCVLAAPLLTLLGSNSKQLLIILHRNGESPTIFGTTGTPSTNNAFLFPQQVPQQVATSVSTNGPTNGTGNPGSPGSPGVGVDFALRQQSYYPIPYNFLGVGGIGLGTALNNDGSAVSQAGFRLTKMGDYDYLSQIFSTAASLTNPALQYWSKMDTELALVVAYHLPLIITLAYTPTWLQPQNQHPPQTNYCLTNGSGALPTRVRPTYLVNGHDTGPQVWGQLAALVVAHVDHNFPQAHPMYEIWNEPDQAQFMCVPANDPNEQQDRLTDYKAIFASAAPQMKQQASHDGVQIEIGGPALGYALQQQLAIWFQGLLDDPSIYPYMDFVTYHRYVFGQNFNSGSSSLVYNSQDPELGITAEYEQVASAVHAGKQPNAATTPIYIDEYNMNSCVPNICRNDPTIGPLNNALFLADLLNSVNDTNSSFGHASAVPAGLAFYTWNIPSQNICMFGVIDTHMDCSTSGTIVPYPQYYTYLLFGGPNYLNMTNGGYVAKSVSSVHPGVYVTGFYTRTDDCIVVVNTTATAFSAFNVTAQNPGSSTSTQATFYTVQYLKSPSNPITSQQVSLTRQSGSVVATVNVPPYTTVAISFAAS